MSKKPANPPAFARPYFQNGPEWSVAQDGMDLRDYFAGQALAGWLASYGMGDVPVPDKIATFAGEIADAMLREREKASES